MNAQRLRRLMSMVAGLSAVATGTPAPAEEPLFGDSFEWVAINGRYWVQDGWMHVRDEAGGPRNSHAAVHTGDTTWTDYVLSLDAHPLFTLPDWQHLIIGFRESNWELAAFHGGAYYADGYQLMVFGPRAGGGYARALTLARTYRGSTGVNGELLLRIDDCPFVMDGPMHFDIGLKGPRIQVSLDGHPIIDVVDLQPHLFGGISVGATFEAESRYDNVVVTPEPLSGLLLAAGAMLATRHAIR